MTEAGPFEPPQAVEVKIKASGNDITLDTGDDLSN